MKRFKSWILNEASIAAIMNRANTLRPKEKTDPVVSEPAWKQLGGKNNEYIYNYKGKWIIDTKHAADRFLQRSTIEISDLEFLFKKAIEWVLKKGQEREYLFFSRSRRQGIVVDYRKDGRGKIKGNNLVVITFLPRGKNNPKEGTEPVMLESYDGHDPDDLMACLEATMQEYGLSTSLLESESDKTVSKTIDIDGFKFNLIFVENKFWDFDGIEYVELD
jgi:hypothetical protein